jgi:hypothetical protein
LTKWRLQFAEKPLHIRGFLDKERAFTEKTLQEMRKKQSGPSCSAPPVQQLAVELLRHRTDTGAGVKPLGPTSWQELKIFPSDFLVSGK